MNASSRPGHDVVESDGSVRPLEDTGFRMPPTKTFVYEPRPNPPTRAIWGIETVSEGDITSKTQAHGLRGVNYITIDVKKAAQRVTDEIAKIINDRVTREETDATLIEA